MKGRKPTPLSLKIVRGNPGRRPLPDALEATDPAKKAPPLEPPAVLVQSAELEAKKAGPAPAPNAVITAREALAEWRLWAPWLQARQLLSDVDAPWLIAYCKAWGRYQNAEKQVELTGDVVAVGPNKYPQQNPYLSIANKALEQCQKFWEQFGGSPSARTRIGSKAGGAGQSRTPRADAFMQRRLARSK